MLALRMNAVEPLITVRDARKYFALKRRRWFSRAPQRIVHAVNHVSLDLEPGRILALVGESGSGKTTLGTLVLGLSRPTAGSILWQGKEVSSLSGPDRVQFRKDVQVVFQDPYGSLNPRMTVAAIVSRPLSRTAIRMSSAGVNASASRSPELSPRARA
jgi:ABC-type glutathione transport system ATPase component